MHRNRTARRTNAAAPPSEDRYSTKTTRVVFDSHVLIVLLYVVPCAAARCSQQLHIMYTSYLPPDVRNVITCFYPPATEGHLWINLLSRKRCSRPAPFADCRRSWWTLFLSHASGNSALVVCVHNARTGWHHRHAQAGGRGARRDLSPILAMKLKQSLSLLSLSGSV